MKFYTWVLVLVLVGLACSSGTWQPNTPAASTPAKSSPTGTARPTAARSPAAAPTIGPTTTPTRIYCRVLTGMPGGKLFLRADPGRESRALGVLSEGDSVLVLETPTQAAESWLYVRSGEVSGWVFGNFCQLVLRIPHESEDTP